METLKQKIAEIPIVRAPHTLKTRILARVAEAAERSLRVYRNFFGALAALSAVLIVPTGVFVVRGFSQSGFASYFSLLFSDGGTALANWKTLLLSLIESAPVLDMTFAFAAVFALLASVRAFVHYTNYTGSAHFSHATL